MADFTNPKPGRKHKAEECFKFRVGNRRKEYLHFFPGRDKGQIRVKLPHGGRVGSQGLWRTNMVKKRSWEIQAFMVRSERERFFCSQRIYSRSSSQETLLAVCRGQSEGNPDKSGCKWNKILQYGQ